MVRAAFLMDRLMAQRRPVGPRFIPLLSSFACAVPGIMATRTIADEKDRLTTILIAPLMTCSARLPVYAVIIAAFIPDTQRGAAGRAAGAGAVRALRRGHRRRVGRRAGAAPHGDQGRVVGLHDGDAAIPMAAAARPRASACGSARGSSCARRHDHRAHHDRAVGAAQLPQAARGPASSQVDYSIAGPHRQRASRSWSRRSASTTTSRSR